jgi:hypothetical protein
MAYLFRHKIYRMKKGLLLIWITICCSMFTLPAQENPTIIKFKASKCDPENAGVDIKKRIVSIDKEGANMIIVVASSANCCATISGEVQLKKSNVLNLIFNDDKDQCQCICGKFFTYILPNADYAGFELNGYKIELTDEAVVAQKVERTYYPNGKLQTMKFFEDDELKRIVFYDEAGEYVKTQYFADGKLESEHSK